MQRRKYLAAALAVCLTLSGCVSRGHAPDIGNVTVPTNQSAAELPLQSDILQSDILIEQDKNAIAPLWFTKEIETGEQYPVEADIEGRHMVLSQEFPLALGVYSGKRLIGSFLLPESFVCTQPHSRIFRSKEEPFGISHISVHVQNTRDPNEEICRASDRRSLGGVSTETFQINGREVTGYTIATFDSDNSHRLLQPENRYYRHILEFDEGAYFVSMAYIAKGIKNQAADKFARAIVGTIRLNVGNENEPVIRTFETWSDFGCKAPLLLEDETALSEDVLQELFAHYCANTHTLVYRLMNNSELEEYSPNFDMKSAQYRDVCYVKQSELMAFGKTYFGRENWDTERLDIPKEPEIFALQPMVKLSYDEYIVRSYNWLNDLYLIDAAMEGDIVTLKLYYDYTRIGLVDTLGGLYCIVKAEWSEGVPVFQTCTVTQTIPASLQEESVRKRYQLDSGLLSELDPKDVVDAVDAFYLGLGLEDQGFEVEEEGMVAYTLYQQTTDSFNKSFGLPQLDEQGRYALLRITSWRADGSGIGSEYYLLSYETGDIVSVTEEEYLHRDFDSAIFIMQEAGELNSTGFLCATS